MGHLQSTPLASQNYTLRSTTSHKLRRSKLPLAAKMESLDITETFKEFDDGTQILTGTDIRRALVYRFYHENNDTWADDERTLDSLDEFTTWENDDNDGATTDDAGVMKPIHLCGSLIPIDYSKSPNCPDIKIYRFDRSFSNKKHIIHITISKGPGILAKTIAETIEWRSVSFVSE